jgi:heat shock protein HtpX
MIISMKYGQKSSNIRRTFLLFTVFLIVIIGIGWAFSRIYASPGILMFAVGLSVLMSFISYWWSDKIVLKISKAQPLKKENNPEIYHIVEKLSSDAGLPMPKIYLINEPAINAFATGRNPRHAVVAVTRGLLEKLDGLEMEGVLSHELSHIGNRDILLSTVVVVLVGFVALLSDFFLRSMFWGGLRGRSDREGGQAQGILMFIGIVLAILSPIAVTLIQLAISRNREFLADASGASLTRHPGELAKALEKISKDATPLKVANKATNHLWIAEPRKSRIVKLFMTHPPVEERIKRLKEMEA